MTVGAVYAARDGDPSQQAEPQKPVAGAKAEPAPQQKPDPEEKPGDKMVFTTKPRLVKTYDIGLHGNLTAVWNLDGTLLAIAGLEFERGADGRPDPKRDRATIDVFSMDGTGVVQAVPRQERANRRFHDKREGIGDYPPGV